MIDNRMRRRRYVATQTALYRLVQLLGEDGQIHCARSLERFADGLGEYVPDAYAGRKEDYPES